MIEVKLGCMCRCHHVFANCLWGGRRNLTRGRGLGGGGLNRLLRICCPSCVTFVVPHWLAPVVLCVWHTDRTVIDGSYDLFVTACLRREKKLLLTFFFVRGFVIIFCASKRKEDGGGCFASRTAYVYLVFVVLVLCAR